MLRELFDALPADAILTDPGQLESYRYDSASFCPAGMPAVVVRPDTVAQVSAVLRVADAHRTPVVPQGARTGLSGGANAVDGAIVLSLQRMNRIVQVDPATRTAVVEPGVVNADLSKAVAEHGLFYPPDPASYEMSTIGGNIATNAGGLCCVKYGVTADFVRGLEVVLASGEVTRTGRRTAKGVAGYDLTRLLVGSEGTLGVITQATVALRPIPAAPRTVAALFDSASAAGKAVVRVSEAGVVPSLLEFMDSASLAATSTYLRMELPANATAMLVAQSDAGGERAEQEIAAISEAFERAGGFDVIEAEDPAEGEQLLAARRQNFFALEDLGKRTGRTAALHDDVCVPVTMLAQVVDEVRELSERVGLPITVVGHVGDGNLHPTVLFDPDNSDESDIARDAFGEIMRIGLESGGTITGEHGVGLLKREWLARELDPASVRLQQRLAEVFDPHRILNPGKLFANPAARA